MKNNKKILIYSFYFLFSVSALYTMDNQNKLINKKEKNSFSYIGQSNLTSNEIKIERVNFSIPNNDIIDNNINTQQLTNIYKPIKIKQESLNQAEEVWKNCKNQTSSHMLYNNNSKNDSTEKEDWTACPTLENQNETIENKFQKIRSLSNNNDKFFHILTFMNFFCSDCSQNFSYQRDMIRQLITKSKERDKRFTDIIAQHITIIANLSFKHQHKTHISSFYQELEKYVLNKSYYNKISEKHTIDCTECTVSFYADTKEALLSRLFYHKMGNHDEEYKNTKKDILKQNKKYIILFAKVSEEYRKELYEIKKKKNF